MAGQGVPVSGEGPHGQGCDVTRTPWPWMSPPGTRGTPVRDRRRKRGGFIAALLARVFGPPAGHHHAPPGPPAGGPPVPPPVPASWDGSWSPGAITLTNITAMRVPPYAPGQRGGRHRG